MENLLAKAAKLLEEQVKFMNFLNQYEKLCKLCLMLGLFMLLLGKKSTNSGSNSRWEGQRICKAQEND